jgi:hypothetical protein
VDDVELITKLKKNMKPKVLALFDKILLRKRSIIETIQAVAFLVASSKDECYRDIQRTLVKFRYPSISDQKASSCVF